MGPFHHGNEKLQSMKEHKLRYLKEFMERANKNLEDLLPVIEPRKKVFVNVTQRLLTGMIFWK
jgi:hypothetical protein